MLGAGFGAIIGAAEPPAPEPVCAQTVLAEIALAEIALMEAPKMVQPLRLTPEQVKRYSRHIIMQDVGSAGQRRMMAASALIIGAGGLGSPSRRVPGPGRRRQAGHHRL